MSGEVITRLDTRELDALQLEIQTEGPALVKAVAFGVEAQAKLNAPVLTGFMRNSIEAEEGEDPLSWLVSVYADYGIYVELGTSRAAAQPFLVPSVERSMQVYRELWRRLFA